MTIRKDFRMRITAEVDDDGSFKAIEKAASSLGRNFEILIRNADRVSGSVGGMSRALTASEAQARAAARDYDQATDSMASLAKGAGRGEEAALRQAEAFSELAGKTGFVESAFKDLIQTDTRLSNLGGGAGVLALAAALSGVVLTIKSVTSAAGELVQAAGTKLFTAFDQGIPAAIEDEAALSKLRVTIARLAGSTSDAAPILERWSGVVDQITASAYLAGSEAQGLAAAVAKMGQEFRISQNDQERLALAVSAFSKSGAEAEQVSGAVRAALNGQAKAAEELGINVNEAAVSSSQYAATLGKAFSEMSDQEKIQARLSLIYDQAATAQRVLAESGTSLASVNSKIRVTLDELSGEFAQSSLPLYKAFAEAQLGVLRLVQQMPQGLKSFISSVTTLSGALLYATGIAVSWSFAVGAAAAAYVGLNFVIKQSITAQALLTSAFAVTNGAMGVQMVTVESLSGAFQNLGFLAKGGLAKALQVAGSAVSALAGAFGSLLLTVAPVALAAAGIAAVFYAAYEAAGELFAEIDFLAASLSGLATIFGQVSAGTSVFERATAALKTGLLVVISTLKNLIKLLSAGFLAEILLVAKGFALMQQAAGKALGVSAEEAAKLQANIDEIDQGLKTLKGSATASLSALASPFETAAMAAAKADEKVRGLTSTTAGFKRTMDLLKDDMGFDPRELKIEALGTEFEKALSVARTAQTEFNKALDRSISAADKTKEVEDELLKTRLSSSKAFLAVQKLQLDTLKTITDAGKTAAVEELKAQGKLVDVARLEAAEREATFEKQVAGLKLLGGLYGKRLAEVNRVRDALVKQREAQIAAAEADQVKKALEEQKKLRAELEQAIDRAYKKADDLQKQAIDLEAENRKVNATALEKIAIEQEKSDIIASNLEAELSALGILNEATQALIDRYRQAAKAKADLAAEDVSLGDLTVSEAYDWAASIASPVYDALYQSVSSFSQENFDFSPIADGLTGSLERGIEKVKAWFKSITLGDLGRTLVMAAETARDLFNGAAVNKFSDAVEGIGGLPKALLEAFDRLGDLVTDLIRTLPTIIQQLVSKVPVIAQAVLEGIPKIIDTLVEAMPRIAATLAEAFPKLLQSMLDALPKLISLVPQMLRPLIEAIPGMVAQIMDALPAVMQALFEAIPQVVADIFRAIPGIIENFLEKLDEFVLGFVDGILSAVGDIAAAFIDTFLLRGGIERIIGAIIRAVPRIAVALVQGIVRGLAKAVGSIANIFKGVKMPASISDLPQNIAVAADKMGAKVAKEASELFQVKDLEAKLGSGTGNIAAGIDAATQRAAAAMRGTWDRLVQAWRSIYESIIQPFLGAFKALWDAVGQLLGQAWQVLKAIWDGVFVALNGLWGVLKSVWDGVISALSAIWNGLREGLTSLLGAFGQIGTTIFQGFRAALEGAGGFLEGVGTRVWEGARKGFETLSTIITANLDKVNPANLLERMFKVDGKGKGTVEKALNIDVPWANFAYGKVPGTARVAGDSFKNDTVMALLSPGEAVIPRSKMQNPAVAELVRDVINGTLEAPRFAFGKVPSFVPSLPRLPTGGIDQVTDLLGRLDPTSGLWTVVQNKVWEGLWEGVKQNAFADGGIVGPQSFASPVQAGASAPLSMFHVERPNFAGLAQASSMAQTGVRAQAGGGGGQSCVIQKIEINAATSMTPESIRREIVPAVERELRRRSQDGRKIIDPAGVRK